MRVYGSTRVAPGVRLGASAPIHEFAHGLRIFACLMIMGALIGIAAIIPWIWVPLLVLFVLAVIGKCIAK